MLLAEKGVGFESVWLAALIIMIMPQTVRAQSESTQAPLIPQFNEQAVISAWKQVNRRAVTYTDEVDYTGNYSLEVSDKNVRESAHGFTAQWVVDAAWYVSLKDDPSAGPYGNVNVGLRILKKGEPEDHFGDIGVGLGTYYIFSYYLNPIEKTTMAAGSQENYLEQVFCKGGVKATVLFGNYPPVRLINRKIAIANPNSFAHFSSYPSDTFSMDMDCDEK